MSTPILIEDSNLSIAWYRVLKYIKAHRGNEITPLVLSLSAFEEDENIKEILDSDLYNNNLDSIDIVSETIFPKSLHEVYGDALFDVYLLKVLPRIKKIDSRNSGGTYFERLISYGNDGKNQLKIIIDALNDPNSKRRSKLQASFFNPLTDHKTGVFQGFPCLQHVTFYKSETGGLILNSFYAMQYLYQRAYGNWLGLINLGKFVAEETNLEFERFNCFVGVEKLDNLTKTEAGILLDKMSMEE